MKIALVFKTTKIAKGVIEAVKNVLDGAEYYPYVDVEAMIKESNQRRIYFDRIIMADSVVENSPSSLLNKLSKYISEESDKTQIVFVCTQYNSRTLKVFKEIFNSPLYVAIVPEKTTTKEVKSFVEDDLQDLAFKYFKEEKYNAVKDQEPVEEEVQSKRRGGLFSKKGAETQESKSPERERPRDRRNRGNTTSNENSRSADGDSSDNYSNSGSDRSDNNSSVGGNNYSGGSFNNNPSSVEGGSENPENSGDPLDDLMTMWDNPTQVEEEKPVEEESVEESESKLRERGNLLGEEEIPIDVNNMTKVAVFVGERGVGVTFLVTELARALYKMGESVLIVDLDFIRNGILSNIDVRDFYAKAKESGIDNKSAYRDEEVDIISNGYAVNVTKQKVRALLADREFLNNYDRVLIDCPIDCIKSALCMEALNNNTVYVVVKGDLLSLSATTIGLTDKSIESTVERYIADNCKVYIKDKMDTFEEDLDIVRDTFYFSNGNWLNNIAS